MVIKMAMEMVMAARFCGTDSAPDWGVPGGTGECRRARAPGNKNYRGNDAHAGDGVRA